MWQQAEKRYYYDDQGFGMLLRVWHANACEY